MNATPFEHSLNDEYPLHFDYPDIEDTSSLSVIDYIFFVLFGSLGVVGIVENLVYMIKRFKFISKSSPTLMDDLHLLGFLIAAFNILLLLGIISAIHYEIAREMKIEAICYILHIVDFAGVFGILFCLIGFARTPCFLLKKRNPIRERSNRSQLLIESVLCTLGVALLYYLGLRKLSNHIYCEIDAVIHLIYISAIVVLLLSALSVSVAVIYKTKRQNQGDNHIQVEYAACQSLKMCILYFFCMIFFCIYQLIGGAFIADLTWVRRIVYFLFYTSSSLFPFIIKLEFPERTVERELHNLEWEVKLKLNILSHI